MVDKKPTLFGLKKTNRDFSNKDTWGKNQFNSSFPASLCCYLAYKELEANYLSIQDGKFQHTLISIEDVFGISPTNSDLYFAFEAQHTPFQKYIIGTLPRTDLVIQKESTGECLSGIEVKLTALPDNTTCELSESYYGSELVVRPDTIVYLACSIASNLKLQINRYLPCLKIIDWSDANQILPHISKIVEVIESISLALENNQRSFLLQPIWKTKSKSSQLAMNCLDIFVWSDAGFTNFICE